MEIAAYTWYSKSSKQKSFIVWRWYTWMSIGKEFDRMGY